MRRHALPPAPTPLAWFALAALAACGPPLEDNVDCGGPLTRSSAPLLWMTGHPLTVEYGFDERCPPPSGVQVSVLDASQGQVEASSRIDGHRAQVTFTPTTAGSHLVAARFDPNRGLGQTVVWVAANRAAEPPTAVLELRPDEVDGVELTATGQVVTAGRGRVYRADDDGAAVLLRDFAGVRTRVCGAVLWVERAPGLARYVPIRLDDGGVGFRGAPGPMPFSALRGWYPAVDDVVTYDERGEVRHLELLADGGTRVRNVGQLPSQLDPPHRVGDQLLDFSPKETCVLELRDGSRRCRSHAAPTRLDMLGGDPGGVWALSTDGLLSRRGQDGAPMFELSVPDGWEVGSASSSPTALPLLARGELTFVVTQRGEQPLLEYWGPSLKSATATTVVTGGPGSRFTLRRR